MTFHKFLLISLLAVGGFFFFPSLVSAATEAGPDISSDTRWTAANSPYIVRDNAQNSGLGILIGVTLTIDPGVVVKFAQNTQILISGTLIARGTSDQPIIFTSLFDDASDGQDTDGLGPTTGSVGDWYRISGGDPVIDFDHVEMRYSFLGLDFSFTTQPLALTNSLLHHNSYAVRLYYSSAMSVIENNTIRDNGRGFEFLNVSNVSNFIKNNNIYNNQVYGAQNLTPGFPIDMSNNWWGHASGPFNLANNPLGQGNAVSDGVLFVPWLLSPFDEEPPPPERNPVIIVPGIPGTELFDEGEKVWIDVVGTALSPSDDFLDVLMMDEEGSTLNNILPGDVIRKIEAIFTFDYSQGLITELQSQGYVEGTDLFTFPYDWRDDISDIATSLNNFINSQENFDNIDIIAHSMGGLVAKEYIQNFGSNHVDKLIFVGSPHLGSPKSAKVLIFGDPMAAIPLLNYQEIKKIARNMSSLNQLLPDQKYFETIGSYLKINGQSLDYATTKQTLIDDLGLNDYLINQAEALHLSGIDDLDLSSINAFNINGCTTATMGSFQVDPDLVRIPANIQMVPGDGTVPLGSSKAVNVSSQNTYFVKKAEHSTMMSFEPIRKLISAILADSTYADSKIIQDISQCKVKGKLLGIFSPVDVKITDQDGNYSGPNEFASFTNNIPGVTYEVLGEEKFVFLPTDEGQTYQIELDATGAGTFDLKISDIDSDVIETIYYNEVSINPASIANFDISATSNDTSIEFDQEGDGSFATLPASSVLNSEESIDETPPETGVVTLGVTGNNGWYRSAVEITLNATDDNSGILKTGYSLDGGQTWQDYESPFVISSQGATTIEFFSTDRAGNREEIQTEIVKIDETPPEASIRFNQTNQDVIFSGIDNLSAVLVNNLGNTVILTDEAGNTTELLLKKSRDKKGLSVEISQIKYNGISTNSY